MMQFRDKYIRIVVFIYFLITSFLTAQEQKATTSVCLDSACQQQCSATQHCGDGSCKGNRCQCLDCPSCTSDSFCSSACKAQGHSFGTCRLTSTGKQCVCKESCQKDLQCMIACWIQAGCQIGLCKLGKCECSECVLPK